MKKYKVSKFLEKRKDEEPAISLIMSRFRFYNHSGTSTKKQNFISYSCPRFSAPLPKTAPEAKRDKYIFKNGKLMKLTKLDNSGKYDYQPVDNKVLRNFKDKVRYVNDLPELLNVYEENKKLKQKLNRVQTSHQSSHRTLHSSKPSTVNTLEDFKRTRQQYDGQNIPTFFTRRQTSNPNLQSHFKLKIGQVLSPKSAKMQASYRFCSTCHKHASPVTVALK